MVEQITKLRKKARKEMQKIVVLTNMKDVVDKLISVMKKHIGEQNKISRLNLFRSVFALNPLDVTELQEWIMWEFIRRGMHRMRQRTHCFIVSKSFAVSPYSARNQGIYYYWVADSYSDLKVYSDNIERNIKAMRNMVKKCERSIKNKWYQEDWSYK